MGTDSFTRCSKGKESTNIMFQSIFVGHGSVSSLVLALDPNELLGQTLHLHTRCKCIKTINEDYSDVDPADWCALIKRNESSPFSYINKEDLGMKEQMNVELWPVLTNSLRTEGITPDAMHRLSCQILAATTVSKMSGTTIEPGDPRNSAASIEKVPMSCFFKCDFREFFMQFALNLVTKILVDQIEAPHTKNTKTAIINRIINYISSLRPRHFAVLSQLGVVHGFLDWVGAAGIGFPMVLQKFGES